MHGSMQNGAPVINRAHRGGTLGLAFLSAVVSLVVSFATAAAPIPLDNIYRAEDGFTNFGISMAIVTYSVGTMAGLLVLGRLSNHLGRRQIAFGYGVLALGATLFTVLGARNVGLGGLACLIVTQQRLGDNAMLPPPSSPRGRSSARTCSPRSSTERSRSC
jgi:MFS family permease